MLTLILLDVTPAIPVVDLPKLLSDVHSLASSHGPGQAGLIKPSQAGPKSWPDHGLAWLMFWKAKAIGSAVLLTKNFGMRSRLSNNNLE